MSYKTINIRDDQMESISRRLKASLPGVSPAKLSVIAMDLYLSLVERGNILKARELAGDETVRLLNHTLKND